MTEAALDEARARRLDGDVTDAHVLVTTGAGGVGKTTIAAAIGLAGAAAGRRTLVLTIDPAKRLAQSMGLERLESTPRRVELPARLEGPGDDAGPGELWAMMLDMGSTFDALVERHARDRRQAAAIKANRIYRTLSSTLSGTQEYMAMEMLHDLHESGEWDLLVIDTPPTRNALDFLDAPKRMTSFLEGRLLRLLMKPGIAAGKGIGRVVGFGATAFMKVAGKVTGMDLLEDLADFFRNFEGMYEGFKQRADEVLELLRDPGSRFVVVTSPQPPPLREARYFLERLEQEGLHSAGLVVNRIHPTLGGLPDDTTLEKATNALGLDDPVAAALDLAADIRRLAGRERRDVTAAMFALSPRAIIEVPLLRSDVHDLDTLAAIAARLTTHEAEVPVGEGSPGA
ncbi:MAG: AAA family ATPase [Actinobacteria bacterium]|nr:AAA family ATPase [Actinomycetota bacterium]